MVASTWPGDHKGRTSASMYQLCRNYNSASIVYCMSVINVYHIMSCYH